MEDQNKFDSWPLKDLQDELVDRMVYFFQFTDGSMKFPNSVEGDILKLTWTIIEKQNEYPTNKKH